MTGLRHSRQAFATMLALCCSTAWSGGIDPYLSLYKIAPNTAGPMMGDKPDHRYRNAVLAMPEKETADPCAFAELGKPLALTEAVERALCNNPKTRVAWATAKVQTALVGVAKSAYLPVVSGTLGYSKQKNVTRYGAAKFEPLNTDAKPDLRSGSLKLSMVLTDFGVRRANLDQASALLDAANANHDAALQAVFVSAAQAYFDTQTAQATLEASREAEQAAKESFDGAKAKHTAGVGALSEQLQAEVAYSKALLERVLAEGELKNSQGTLATVMGFNANTAIILARHPGGLPDTDFVKSADELIEDAKQNHPALLAAQAELRAARAKVEATRAEGRPSVTMSAEMVRYEQHNQPPAIGYEPTDISNRNTSLGIQMNVPIFEGFGRGYRISGDQGKAEIKAAELAQLEQQVSLDVWKSYQSLNTETEGLKATDILLSSARSSFKIARGRFKAGVGSMSDLLTAQSAVANAEQQRIKSVSNWRTARLKLAANIGKLGLWAIE